MPPLTVERPGALDGEPSAAVGEARGADVSHSEGPWRVPRRPATGDLNAGSVRPISRLHSNGFPRVWKLINAFGSSEGKHALLFCLPRTVDLEDWRNEGVCALRTVMMLSWVFFLSWFVCLFIRRVAETEVSAFFFQGYDIEPYWRCACSAVAIDSARVR